MPRFFVSYRIEDSVHAASVVADRLAERFGKDNVFRDRDSLSLGSLYPKKIRRALEQCDLLLAMLGPSWLNMKDHAGRRRLDDPDDWVRTELRMAFKRGIRVVPVLLDHTPLPGPAQLPVDIALLSRSTCWHIRHETFESDVRGLIDGVAQPTGGVPPLVSPQSTGTNTQHNYSSGGTVIAHQGSGNQTVNGIDFGGNPR